MTLADFRKILEDNTISCDQFLRVHNCVEELWRRMLLIGLRKKDLQYKDAELISEIYFNSNKEESIELILKYCGIDYKDLLEFGNYEDLQNLFLYFTSRHRNRLVHGIELTISNKEFLELLITIDKSLIAEFEAYLKYIGKPTLINEPTKWGAKKGVKKDPAKVWKELLKRKMPSLPEYNKKKASDLMKKIKQSTSTSVPSVVKKNKGKSK